MPKIGKATHYTEEQISKNSEITEDDIALAIAMWLRYSVSPFRGLIDNSSEYKFDLTRRVWMKAGKAIDPLVIRNRAIEPFLNNMRILMRETSEQLQRGEISLAEWQIKTAQYVKVCQVAPALIANGGVKSTSPTDYEKIALFILLMLVFLSGFAEDIDNGKQPFNGLLLSRTDLYAKAGRDAYEEMVRYEAQNYLGRQYERRVLDENANHCHSVDGWLGCPELAEMGWKRIGTLPRIYDTPCRTNCACHWEFR